MFTDPPASTRLSLRSGLACGVRFRCPERQKLHPASLVEKASDVSRIDVSRSRRFAGAPEALASLWLLAIDSCRGKRDAQQIGSHLSVFESFRNYAQC